MSRLPFEVMLALRYLRPKRTFVSAITLISIVGVMLGVAVLIIVISVMSGFDRELRSKIVSFNGELRVVSMEGTMTNYSRLISRIATNRFVRGVAPYINGQVLLETEPADGKPSVIAPLLRGVDPRYARSVTDIPDHIIEGKFNLRGYSLLVGSDLANRLGLQVSDHVAIYSVKAFEDWRQSRQQGSDEAYLADDYVVNGIFNVGMADFDAMYVVTSLANAQDLYDLPNQVHGLFVSLKNPDLATQVQTTLERELGPDYRITTWMEENSEILEVLVVEKHMMFYLLFFITIVASFGICSALITFVVQKTREIGALKALGATSSQVLALFLAQSLAVGAIGVTLGFGLGVLAVSYRNQFLFLMRRLTGIELFPANIYHFYQIPAALVPSDIGVICGSSMLICVLVGGLIPAWNAARLKPAEALRHE